MTLRINRTAQGDAAIEFRPTAKQSYALKWRDTGAMYPESQWVETDSWQTFYVRWVDQESAWCVPSLYCWWLRPFEVCSP